MLRQHWEQVCWSFWAGLCPGQKRPLLHCLRPRSGDSFIPFLVWGLFNLCRRLPKTYKPPLKTDKTPLETDKPPPKTNKPPLETDKPPPETDKPPPKTAKLPTALSTTITGRSRSLNPSCQHIVCLLCSTFPLKFPLFGLFFPLNSH